MPSYSQTSESRLEMAHPDIQLVFREVLKRYDHTIAKSYETKAESESYFDQGLSKIHYPTKHNSKPSIAVDVYPYIKGKAIFGANEEELKQVLHFAGYVMATADIMLEEGKITHKFRNGGDWNMDNDISKNDNPFEDGGHFELVVNPGEIIQYFEV